jgi:hypothetical protein
MLYTLTFLCFVSPLRGVALLTPRSFLQGLARISHRPKLKFATVSKYAYDTHGGSGVDVYVIDTGRPLVELPLDLPADQLRVVRRDQYPPC